LEENLQEQPTLGKYLTHRANTIAKRYKEGELSDAEAAYFAFEICAAVKLFRETTRLIP